MKCCKNGYESCVKILELGFQPNSEISIFYRQHQGKFIIERRHFCTAMQSLVKISLKAGSMAFLLITISKTVRFC